ncbi:recombinase family protein [Bacteroides acidifaciens]|uniref:recombinase family protein n=1 Tax=Bacteroides acidifaciens TaxID=85831 RepID=UPI0025B3549E|nr:recombinase family protein [Bacteroides acidifaciens]
MAVVKAIPPQSREPSLKKVAAYCRVSTKSQEQLDNLAAQECYYEERIRANPNWKFAGIYSDIGSGTTIKGRRRFNALLSVCRRGKIDMVLIKSAHRFARNTVDALETIRMLRRWKVDIYFEVDDIHTLYENSEFMLTLICTRAQDESESRSADIKWGIQKSFADPDSKYYQRVCYGYKHDENGRLIIDEEKAEVVRMIFRLSGEGVSLSQIAQELQEQGVPSPRGKAVWSKETLRKILRNENTLGQWFCKSLL